MEYARSPTTRERLSSNREVSLSSGDLAESPGESPGAPTALTPGRTVAVARTAPAAALRIDRAARAMSAPSQSKECSSLQQRPDEMGTPRIRCIRPSGTAGDDTVYYSRDGRK